MRGYSCFMQTGERDHQFGNEPHGFTEAFLYVSYYFIFFFFSPHRKKGDLPKRTSLDLQAACSYLFVTDCCSQRPPKFLNNKGCLSNPANVWAHAQCLLMIMQLFCNKEFQQYHVRRESLIISATRNQFNDLSLLG